MILEAGYLFIKKGEEGQFEEKFKLATQYISSIDGYIRHSLKRCIEQENKYLLLVEWETLEAHMVGFRKSEAFLEWRKLIGPYFEAAPNMEHFNAFFENEK
ncbi:antibiotic biosynthesis monooxygenase [Saprospiraceae bacterium]|jgi:heme-degrading monooxygenase HmoA|nr:antibiotic biosynthesis monooxygenase [Bacteroidota bacterium]MDB4728479.1 antibiotic biosynthesis monooxygenase [Saprospiraceae bacterium]MDF1866493.1 antibiotic biosynthesis monooxygenase [Saprospiraceae bacterium]